ncbi:MAG: hypothetical protein L0H93_16785 [Nocardioides sp.]|nr:hypothetical protein [Nocardioides sp.]
MTDHEDKPKLEIDWVKTFAGALAAVSSAVLLSTLGAAGTLIGAALGSIILTLSSAVYSQGLARSRAKLAAAQELAQQKVGMAKADVRRASRKSVKAEVGNDLDHATEQLDEATSELEDATAETGALTWKERLAVLPWKRIAVAAVGTFLVAMLIITAFELLTGRAVSSYTGGSDSKDGTSISRLTGGNSGDDGDKLEKDQRKDQQKDPGQPTGTPETSDPSTAPSEAPSESSSPDEDTPSEPSESTPPAETSIPDEGAATPVG